MIVFGVETLVVLAGAALCSKKQQSDNANLITTIRRIELFHM